MEKMNREELPMEQELSSEAADGTRNAVTELENGQLDGVSGGAGADREDALMIDRRRRGSDRDSRIVPLRDRVIPNKPIMKRRTR